MKQDHGEAELDTDAAAFLDSVRGLDEPTAKDRHRVRRRVLAAVAATGAASAAGGTAATAAAATGGAAGATGAIGSTLAAKVWIGVAIGLVGAGVAGGVATLAPDDEVVVAAEPAEPAESLDVVPEAPAADQASAPVPEAELAPEMPEPEPEPEPAGLGQTVPDAPAASRVPSTTRRVPEPSAAPTVAPSPEPVADPDTLAAELGLIRRAHAAANAGNHMEALRILGEHASRFPSGSLAVEREGARAISLCGAGRTTEGRPLAERFLRTHPGSPLRGRVSRACAD